MSRVWKQLNWVVLAQDILWGCSQDVSQGCSHLKGRGANSRMSHSGGSQNSASYFQEASVPHPLDVFIELLQLFRDWLSPEYVTQERARWKPQCPLWPGLGSTRSFMQYSIDYTGQPGLVWEEIAQSVTAREEGIIGGHRRG